MAANAHSATPSPAQPGDGVDISAVRARQAFPGRRILWILMTSLVAVVVAFIVAFATNSTNPVSDKGGNGRVKDPALAQQFDTPVPEPKPPG